MEVFQLSWRSVLMVVTLLMMIVDLPRVDADAVPWNYHIGQYGGPDQWHINFSDCGGIMQSPIEIETEHVLYDPELELFDLSDYSKVDGVDLTLVNKGGHTAEVIYSGEPIYIRGGSLPGVYKLDQFHFHWGEVDGRGSEHGMDGQHFPMELHLVHHQDRLSPSIAPEHPYGLAVIGFFFKVVKNDNPKLNMLLQHFPNITSAAQDEEIEIPTFSLTDSMPTGRLDYYRYHGSLTTPPCYESVIWSIATEKIEISENQLNLFRALRDSEDAQLVDDFRPIQPRNRRLVTTTKLSYGDGDSGNILAASNIVVLFSALACLLVRQY